MGDNLSLLPLVVLLHVGLLFCRELAESVNNFAVVVLAASNVFGGTHNGNVALTGTSAYVVPVDEVDVSELTEVKNAVLDGDGFASAEEYGTEVTVGIHRSEVTGLVYVSAELSVYGAGVTILMLFSKVGDHLSHNVEKVVLQEL